jgi:hypothetical protein
MASEQPIEINPAAGPLPVLDPARWADAQIGSVSNLLSTLEAAPSPSRGLLDTAEMDLENQLIQVRLGVASSLFAALRAKHAPTAHHRQPFEPFSFHARPVTVSPNKSLG